METKNNEFDVTFLEKPSVYTKRLMDFLIK